MVGRAVAGADAAGAAGAGDSGVLSAGSALGEAATGVSAVVVSGTGPASAGGLLGSDGSATAAATTVTGVTTVSTASVGEGGGGDGVADLLSAAPSGVSFCCDWLRGGRPGDASMSETVASADRAGGGSRTSGLVGSGSQPPISLAPTAGGKGSTAATTVGRAGGVSLVDQFLTGERPGFAL